MTKKEYSDRNIGVMFDFVRHIIDHPEIIETIPSGAQIDFIDKDFKMIKPARGKNIARYNVRHVFEPITKVGS